MGVLLSTLIRAIRLDKTLHHRLPYRRGCSVTIQFEEDTAELYNNRSNKSRILRIVSSTTEVITMIASFTSVSPGGVVYGIADTVPVAVSTAVGADVGCDVGAGFGAGIVDIVSIGHISS